MCEQQAKLAEEVPRILETLRWAHILPVAANVRTAFFEELLRKGSLLTIEEVQELKHLLRNVAVAR